jgi:hypothetical protein
VTQGSADVELWIGNIVWSEQNFMINMLAIKDKQRQKYIYICGLLADTSHCFEDMIMHVIFCLLFSFTQCNEGKTTVELYIRISSS